MTVIDEVKEVGLYEGMKMDTWNERSGGICSDDRFWLSSEHE